MKVVTKRKGTQDPLEEFDQLQRVFNQIKQNILIPRGVYKFQTFEEANKWMIKTMAHTHVSQNLKT